MICYDDIDAIDITEYTAVTAGKFDGVHKGHQKLLSELIKAAGKDLKTLVIRLKPMNHAQKRLMTDEETAKVFEALGVDILVELRLDSELMQLSAESFVRDILIEKCRMKTFVCGADFSFGRGRAGNEALLKTMGKSLGFKTIVFKKETEEEMEVSSTRIRKLLEAGDLTGAEQLLGRSYSISGTVIHGRHLATSLGFPTANVIPDPEKILPPFGVYAVQAEIDGVTYPGMANLGVKPTVTEDEQVLLEVSLMNFSGDLYDKKLKAEFLRFIRPEQKFSSIEELKKQLKKDYEACRSCFDL